MLARQGDGGTSMGSVIAAQVALGLSREMIDLTLRFMSRKSFAQYAVPMLALLNAKRTGPCLPAAGGNTLY